MQNLPLVCKAFQDKEVVAFFRKILRESYSGYFHTHSTEAKQLVDKALDAVITGQQQNPNILQLVNDAKNASKYFLNNDSPKYWFRDEYFHYKTIGKCEADYQKTKSHIFGKKVLDFGCGDGSFTNYLIKQGYDAWGSDIVEYPQLRLKPSRFREINSRYDFQLDNEYFDTVFIKTVLHHIENDQIAKILTYLHCRSQRLIIKEEVVGTGIDICDRSCIAYSKLSIHQQRNFLILQDFFGNIIVQGYDFMSLPFHFHSIQSWKKIFSKFGYSLNKIIPACFENNTPHKNAYIWMIFDAI